jgi:hypothetical protein
MLMVVAVSVAAAVAVAGGGGAAGVVAAAAGGNGSAVAVAAVAAAIAAWYSYMVDDLLCRHPLLHPLSLILFSLPFDSESAVTARERGDSERAR